MLLLVYTFNFIDRQIIGVLAIPIKTELGLSDTQLGALGGLAFALFYTALGIPIAWAADRRSRTWIMTVSLALWSAFTALCGVAGNFWQLFLCRLGVGVGEAGGVAPAYALISDYFPRESRARALAFYSFGIPIGSALGIFLGGWIASSVDWRTAFLTVGLAGVVLAPLFRLVVREPMRGRYDPPAARTEPAALGEVMATLARKPAFWLLAFGASSSSTVGYGLIFWLPSFFGRSFGLKLFDLSLFYGSIIFIGGMVGVWCGGWLGDRLGSRDPKYYALVPASAFVIAVPLYVAGVMAPAKELAFLLFLVPQALALMWLGPVLSAIQHLVPPNMRATASASFLFINNLIGIGFGTLFFGLVSDALAARFGDQSLRYAILIGLGFYLIAAALLALASRHLAKDWHR
ncbi:spinster family MFS transporter [Sphingomonas oleivorans]|nr:MFS transporter [Sphingomonas oleivorans]